MRRTVITIAAALVVAGTASADQPARPGLEGTIWVGNRAQPVIAAFAAESGAVLGTVALEAAASDVAAAKGKVYVGEESLNRIAVIADGAVVRRIATASRPHHLAAGSGGILVAYGAFGSNMVGLIDASSDTLVGEWPASASADARVHAAALSRNGQTLYTANDRTNEVGVVSVGEGLLYTIPVSRAHELVVTPDERWAYVSCRSDNRIRVLDLSDREIVGELAFAAPPDTLQLSADGKQLTVGLRGAPAQLAVLDVDGSALSLRRIVDLPGTLAGHQWTSRNGRWTFAAYEGPTPGLAVVDHETDTVVQTIAFPGGGQPHGIDYAGPQAG